MKIAIRYMGLALVSDNKGRCRTADWCDGPANLCKLGICIGARKFKLEKHLGPHVWSKVGEGLPDVIEVLVLFEGDIYKAVPRVKSCRAECDCFNRELCKRHCEALNEEALCHVLGAFFGIEKVSFKKVSV